MTNRKIARVAKAAPPLKPVHQLDAIDRKILAILQEDARITNRELAKRVNLSPTPCLRRVHLMERSGLITRYRAVVDVRQIGYTVRAFVQVQRTHRVEKEAVWRALVAIPEVIACHVISGESELILEILAVDMQHYSQILLERINKIEGVYDSRTMFAIKTLKLDASAPTNPLAGPNSMAR